MFSMALKWRVRKATTALPLHFMPEAIPPENRTLLLSLFNHYELYYQNVDQYQLPAYFDHLSEFADMPEPLRRIAIMAELQALLSHMLYMSLSSDSSAPHEPNSETISRIIMYLNNHLTEPISLDEISDRFFISKHHLNKVFRTATGTTVGEYVIHKRVASAQQLILNGCSAMQAAAASGLQRLLGILPGVQTDCRSCTDYGQNLSGHRPILIKQRYTAAYPTHLA